MSGRTQFMGDNSPFKTGYQRTSGYIFGSMDFRWSDSDLEGVTTCPVCESGHSTLLHPGLVDLIFEAGPDAWALFSCEVCGSAYLNPRPRRESIHHAYTSYYTHGEASTKAEHLPNSERIRRRLRYGYLNSRYGYHLVPASRLGAIAIPLLPSERARTDRLVRYLPKPKQRARLLDIGCGNGAFLQFMKQEGWEVQGFDADAEAVASTTTAAFLRKSARTKT